MPKKSNKKGELWVQFAFKIGDHVAILPLELMGRISSRCDSGKNFQTYRIVYYVEKKRYADWFHEHELKRANKERG